MFGLEFYGKIKILQFKILIVLLVNSIFY